MKRIFAISLSLLCIYGLGLAEAAASDAQDTLRKARAFLGSEDKLNTVGALQYEGAFVDAKTGYKGMLVMIFKKPDMQKVTRETEGSIEITGTDGHEGFRMSIFKDEENEGTAHLRVIGAKQLQSMIINAVENLYFYRGYQERRGKLIDKGMVEFDGEKAHQLAFKYPNGLVYNRYFDPETGELLGLLGPSGVITRELNFMTVDGIRFPEKIEVTQDGELLYTVNFNKVVVNPILKTQLFEFPNFSGAEKQ